MDESTERFLFLMERQNVAIAAQAAAREQQAVVNTDQVRLQREQERREKWGQLRAREKPGKRNHQVSRVFPHIDLS